MHLKSAIALAATLGAFAFATPAVSSAEDQSEWLQRQLQMTDGYAPPPAQRTRIGDRTVASKTAPQQQAFRAPLPAKSALPSREMIHQRGRAHGAVYREYAGGQHRSARTECTECEPAETNLVGDPESFHAWTDCTDCESIGWTQEAETEPMSAQAECVECARLDSQETDSEPVAAQAECRDCVALESTPRENDGQGSGIGLAALAMLLVVAGFKVTRTVGAMQRG